MIAPAPEKPVVTALAVPERPSPLPVFQRLVIAAAFVNGPLIALALIFGRPWLAGSLTAGVAISLATCGLLHAFVVKIMPLFVAGLQGQSARGANPAAVMQFVALIIVKFLALGLAGYAILNYHQINLVGVALGFALAQTAIVVTVARHRTPR